MSEVDLTDVMQELSVQFDKLCQERHLAGQKEYGEFTFLGNDIIRMMAEELADTSNYIRYQFIKLMILQAYLEDKLVAAHEGEERDTITIGIQSFKGVGETGWDK